MVFLPRFNYGLLAAILLALASPWIGGLTPAIILTLALTGAVLTDLLFIPREALRVTRKVPPILRQAQSFEVELTLGNRGENSTSFQVVDSPPADFTGSRPTLAFRLRPGQQTVRTYALKSYRRGGFAFGAVFYRSTGPLGLIQRQGKIELPQEVQVVPDLAGEGSRDLQLALAGATRSGRRRSPRRGDGREFESLREHQHDDDFRSIDWKASAKRGKLICRQYETERDQRLMILLDTGRLMRTRIGDYRKLDYAINASVHLAQAALRKGDLVGYSVFSNEPDAYAEPGKGQAQLARLVRELTPLQPNGFDSDYATAFHQLMRKSSRRTLVICFTDLGDPQAANRLLQAAVPLVPRHLPVMVTVSNSEILAVAKSIPTTEFEVYRTVAATEIWNDYQHTLRVLRSRGILTVSVPADELSAATVNEYLHIKDSARL
jgi:uncharacterized protein (DUF58 family)